MDEKQKLFDDTLEVIFSRLPMRDVYRLSAVSHRWVDFWKSVPRIDFSNISISQAPGLIEGIDKAINHREHLIKEFRIHVEYNLCPTEKVESWIQSLKNHKVQVLYLDLTPSTDVFGRPFMPDCILDCEFLENLTIKSCDFDLPQCFCLNFLKIISFESMSFKEKDFTTLLGNCPVLKVLTLKNCNLRSDLRIISEKHSYLETINIEERIDSEADDPEDASIFEVSVPSLKRLNIFGSPRRSDYIGSNLKFLVAVDFDFGFPSKFTPFWEDSKRLIYYGRFIEDFCLATLLKLSSWCTTVSVY